MGWNLLRGDYVEMNNDLLIERLSLVMERVEEIQTETVLEGAELSFFQYAAKQCSFIYEAWKSQDVSKETNKKLYDPVREDVYETSFFNPEYAVKELGESYGHALSMILTRIAGSLVDLYKGNPLFFTLYTELLVEMYGLFCDKEDLSEGLVKENIYSFMHDNSDLFMEDAVNAMVDPSFDTYYQLVMKEDLSSEDYLYKYGMNISRNETEIAAFLNSLSEEEINSMTKTYTEGYVKGFEMARKDLSKKTTAVIHYPVGFERMVRQAIVNFEAINLRVILNPASTSANKQFLYDHREDDALWLDKAFVERRLEAARTAFEEKKELARGVAGPAVIETFGEEPFSPKRKKEALTYNEKQQEVSVYFRGEYMQLVFSYIPMEERSFTIIAYPIPEIGDKFKEIFAETVKVNTLDYKLYQDIQQKLINALDTAKQVHILGKGANKTDLYVSICPLEDPSTQTAFENCVADVNIPVGEVFTSPVLKGTTGKLHVTQVYLKGLKYENLDIDFKDGMIVEYGCSNFDDPEEGKKFFNENVMNHQETLPMGEFAIGTNTTAYMMGRKYDIQALLPILIAEKTGPHFAVGDTCFFMDEDNATYNPDGKQMMAKENEVTVLRKEDPTKAYFNCHTDITIPYDELGRITAISESGSEIDIIVDGRFVLPGTEELNKALDEQ